MVSNISRFIPNNINQKAAVRVSWTVTTHRPSVLPPCNRSFPVISHLSATNQPYEREQGDTLMESFRGQSQKWEAPFLVTFHGKQWGESLPTCSMARKWHFDGNQPWMATKYPCILFLTSNTTQSPILSLTVPRVKEQHLQCDLDMALCGPVKNKTSVPWN